MNVSPLERKTVRPGSMGNYSYYHSDRHRVPASQVFVKPTARRGRGVNKLLVTLAVLAALIVLPLLRPFGGGDSAAKLPSGNPQVTRPASAAIGAVIVPTAKSADPCASRQDDKLVLVSVSQRHLWACQASKTVYDTPVITGILSHPETLTPPGTYHIGAKITNTTLKGSDSTGSWNDPVYYWMPFLDNQNGTYGFHDATWRADSEFGNIDPNSADASHGCVELPLAASKWLYDWAPVHTAVTVET
jgi:lipoprotein-anchoring transpeptidase ErfK/SrfK